MAMLGSMHLRLRTTNHACLRSLAQHTLAVVLSNAQLVVKVFDGHNSAAYASHQFFRFFLQATTHCGETPGLASAAAPNTPLTVNLDETAASAVVANADATPRLRTAKHNASFHDGSPRLTRQPIIAFLKHKVGLNAQQHTSEAAL